MVHRLTTQPLGDGGPCMGGRGRELCLTLGSRCWREAGKAVIPGWGGSLCLPKKVRTPRSSAASGPSTCQAPAGPNGPLEESVPTSQPVPIARSCHGDPLPPSATAFPVKPLQKSILPDRHALAPHPPLRVSGSSWELTLRLPADAVWGSGERELTVPAWAGEEKVSGGQAPASRLQQLQEVGELKGS